MDPGVEEYINKQVPLQKEICKRLREVIIDTYPDILEKMKWGAPTYGIKRSDGVYIKYYIGAFKDHVNLGFTVKYIDPEDLGKFEGSGKTMRHIKIFTLEDIDRERIVGLLRTIPD